MAGTSEARIRANRLNAQRSTGPKTAAGKARVRVNAVKHGLTGKGLALPTEDAAVVERRFAELHDELAPTTLEQALLVHQAALMSVRMERAARYETASLAQAARHAATEFDLAYLAEVDRLFDTIEESPREHYRRLIACPEGVDRLISALGAVRDQVGSGMERCWGEPEWLKVGAFFGSDGSLFPIARADALLIALRGNFQFIRPDEIAPLTDPGARIAWARGELIRLAETEIARLTAHRAELDSTRRPNDAHDAAARTLFDPSPVAILARRYEAASTRAFFRSLRDFHALAAAEDSADAAATDPLPLDDATPDQAPPTESDPSPVAAVDSELTTHQPVAVDSPTEANAKLPNKAIGDDILPVVVESIGSTIGPMERKDQPLCPPLPAAERRWSPVSRSEGRSQEWVAV